MWLSSWMSAKTSSWSTQELRGKLFASVLLRSEKIARYKSVLGLVGILAFSTGCESPFMHENKVSAGFHPGISLDMKQTSVRASGTTVVAGSSIGVLVTLKDQNGSPWVDSTAKVSLVFSGGGSTGTFSGFKDNKDGTYTAVLLGVRAGTPSTVSAVVNGQPVTTQLPQVTVVPGPESIADSQLTVSASRVSAGASVRVLFVVTDKYGNPVGESAKGKTIALSYSGGTSQGNFDSVVDNQDGTYSCNLTGAVAGSPSRVAAAIAGLSPGSVDVQVVAGSPATASSSLTVSAPQVASGNSVTITLVSKDAYGNPAGSGHSVVFYQSGGTSTGSISASVDGGNGTYTGTFTGVTSGSPTTIHAKIDGEDVVTTLPQCEVIAGGASAIRSVISSSASIVPSGSSATLSLTLRDQNGNLVKQSGLSVVFFYAGGTSTGTIAPTSYQGDGVYSANFTGQRAGTPIMIGATLGGTVAGGGAQPVLSVIPGPFSAINSLIAVSSPSVSVFGSVQLSLTAKDSYGNLIVSGGLPVSFNYGGGSSTGNIGSVVDTGSGVYSASFTGTGAGTPVAIGASIGGSPILSASPALTVVPATVSLALSTVSVSSPSIVSGAQSNLSLTLRDAGGNVIKDSNQSVVFTRSGGTSTGSISTATYDSATGKYNAVFTGLLAGTATQISATVGGGALTSAAPSITVTPGAYTLANSTISVPSYTVVAGASLPVTVTLKDAQGNVVPNGSVAVVVSNHGGTSQGTFGAVTYAGAGLYTTNFTGTVSGSATTLGATLDGGTISGPNITVTPGNLSLAQSTISVSPTSIQSGDQATLTLIAKDSNGNPLSTGGLAVVFTQSVAAMGQISAVTDAGNEA
ncbi:MAG: hypothetical protein HYX41_01415 [Bdellovibrio sp.]|nr:hypothetical protein [Bdellovibrio sp.]